MDTYNVGPGTNQITIEAKVTTVASAHTHVVMVKSDKSIEFIEDSSYLDGYIPPASIGKQNDIKGNSLRITTSIHYAETSDQNADTFTISYILNGGPDQSTFNLTDAVVSKISAAAITVVVKTIGLA